MKTKTGKKITEEKITVKKHYVTFASPGTFFSESTTKEIKSWDVKKAVAMSKKIVERYNARPFGFRFSTWGRGPDDLDSKKIASSGFYYLGGKIETLEEIKRRNNPDDRMLIANMECNGWDKVITNMNSYKATLPFLPGDTVLE